MRSRQWMARLVAITAVGASASWVAVPGVSAAAGHSPATSDAIGHAAQSAAPLVADSGPPRAGKRGLAAPAMTASMLSANAEKQAAAAEIMQVMTAKASPGSQCASLSCQTGLPAAKDLLATQQAQILDYFCGPATVSEMLAQMHVSVSQHTAARELGTTPGGTDWSNASGYPVPEALNANQKLNDYVAVALPWSPTTAQIRTYETDLVTDLNHKGGVPLAGNAYEVAAGPHLAGNPVDQTIFHWFDIRGYQDSGAVTDYEDSVHGASSIGWATQVPAYSSMASSTIVNILGARGYMW
jgi:hypothetical protein